MASGLPLLDWRQDSEHHRVRIDRERLLARIAKLKPHAHKRVGLEERVKLATLRLIEIENQMSGRKGGHND